MLVLTILQGPDKGRQFELPANEPQMIGRSSESLPLSDQTISRRHAELTPDDGRWYIRDLHSSNGTFLNGLRVTDRRLLRPGDQVRTGSTLFVFGQNTPIALPPDIHVARKGEMDVSVEHMVSSNDSSIIMASPDPSQAAEFQLQVLYKLTELIGSVTNQRELLERIMDMIFEYLQADHGFILLVDNPAEFPEPVVVRHRLGMDPTDNEPTSVSRTIVRYVLRRGVAVLSSNAMSDKRFELGDSVQAMGIRSAICAPIKFKNTLYGVIHLDSKIANYTYTEDQLLLLTAIGAETGLALANARLLEERIESERLATVGQTVASISHSIKNILQGLRGGADVVELGLRKNNTKVLRNGWAIVSRNLDRIYDLAMNMLTYSKQRDPDRVMTNITHLLNEVIALVQKQFDAKKIKLDSKFGQDLPPVPIDPAGIHQAVLNLLNNAVDAVESELGVVRLDCTYDSDHDEVQLLVTDNGEGMTTTTRKRLFEPFQSTKGLRGTGLGLVVTKKIVEEHGGTITVDSKRGQGSIFKITLPTTFDAAPTSAETQGPG